MDALGHGCRRFRPADADPADAGYHGLGECAAGSSDYCSQKAMIAKRDEARANAERILNQPQNRTTRDESQFLNEFIERKAFSWTRVLENLEKVMPPRVHVVAIDPELDEDNQLALKMRVAGDSRDRAIELARRMEASRRFAQTAITTENHVNPQTGDTEQFDIVAIYIPETPARILNRKRSPLRAAWNRKARRPRPQQGPKTQAAKGIEALNARSYGKPGSI